MGTSSSAHTVTGWYLLTPSILGPHVLPQQGCHEIPSAQERITIGGLIYLIGFKNIYVLFASMFLSPALTLLPILVLYVQLLTGHLQVICLLNTFTLTHSQWNT